MINDVLVFIKNGLKNPFMIPIYIALGIWAVLSGIWKFITSFQEKIENKIDDKFKEQNSFIDKKLDDVIKRLDENTKATNTLLYKSPVFEAILEMTPILKQVVDIVSDDNSNIFDDIKTEIVYMREAFKKNYSNGSQREKSEDLLLRSETNIMEFLSNGIEHKTSFSEVILCYSEVMRAQILELIQGLEAIASVSAAAHLKLSLISRQFQNLNNLLTFTKIKCYQLSQMKHEEIIAELEKHFYNLDIKKPEFNLNALAQNCD
jgi:hypothetical protein